LYSYRITTRDSSDGTHIGQNDAHTSGTVANEIVQLKDNLAEQT